MTAHLTPDERALIDAAIAAGKVTVVPIGATTAPVYQWQPSANGESGKLVQVGGADVSYRQQGKNFLAQARKAAAARRHLRPDVVAAQERLPRVKELAAQGLTRSEIAAALGVARTTIVRDCKVHGIEAANPQEAARARAVARVREYAAQGHTIKQIAKLMGRNYDAIKRYCTEEKIELVNGHDANKAKRAEAVKKAIAGKDDYCLAQIAKDLGMNRQTVRRYIAQVGT